MLNFLIKKFIKDSNNTDNPDVRAEYGKFSGKVGIFSNIMLFIGKFIAGTVSGSVSIKADAINNLSDAASSIISLIGFKVANLPADENHPYGHARFEYVTGLTISVMILFIGYELFKQSIVRLIHPSPIEFNMVICGILIVSIIVKLWLAHFNSVLGKAIDSPALEATAADSRNDVFSTGAVLAASLISYFWEINLDGIMGIIVAVVIFASGIALVKETLSPIIGKAPDPDFVEYIHNKILSYDGVLGTHDLMVHDYGPGRQFASVHVEMAAENDVLESHEIIDTIERDFINNDHLNLVIHFDPIVTKDDSVHWLRKWICGIVTEIHPDLTIHDLRVVPGKKQTNVIFDCVRPPFMTLSDDELRNKIIEKVHEEHPDYCCIITVDDSFAAMPHTHRH